LRKSPHGIDPFSSFPSSSTQMGRIPSAPLPPPELSFSAKHLSRRVLYTITFSLYLVMPLLLSGSSCAFLHPFPYHTPPPPFSFFLPLLAFWPSSFSLLLPRSPFSPPPHLSFRESVTFLFLFSHPLAMDVFFSLLLPPHVKKEIDFFFVHPCVCVFCDAFFPDYPSGESLPFPPPLFFFLFHFLKIPCTTTPPGFLNNCPFDSYSHLPS